MGVGRGDVGVALGSHVVLYLALRGHEGSPPLSHFHYLSMWGSERPTLGAEQLFRCEGLQVP